eukprot:COSAG04_NODE_8049_length_1030_cov_1.263158_1_plen_47_part_10
MAGKRIVAPMRKATASAWNFASAASASCFISLSLNEAALLRSCRSLA